MLNNIEAERVRNRLTKEMPQYLPPAVPGGPAWAT